jgi:hypothetical protein
MGSLGGRVDRLEQQAATAKRAPVPLDDETRARMINDLLAGRVEGDPDDIARRQALVLAILDRARRRAER